jgi:hypothetical protein
MIKNFLCFIGLHNWKYESSYRYFFGGKAQQHIVTRTCKHCLMRQTKQPFRNKFI